MGIGNESLVEGSGVPWTELMRKRGDRKGSEVRSNRLNIQVSQYHDQRR